MRSIERVLTIGGWCCVVASLASVCAGGYDIAHHHPFKAVVCFLTAVAWAVAASSLFGVDDDNEHGGGQTPSGC